MYSGMLFAGVLSVIELSFHGLLLPGGAGGAGGRFSFAGGVIP
jgi:hypothetical protein